MSDERTLAADGESTLPGTPLPDVGDIVGGYRVVAQIGGGRSGVVYKVRHLAFRTNHLMKVLRVREASVEEGLRRLVADQTRLRHPNALPFTAILDTPAVFALLVDASEGPTLREILQDGKGMPADDALPLFAEMLAGVHAAHRLGIVHLALTPDVVRLVTVAERVVARVSDFGLARGLHRLPSPESGGARYIAPELGGNLDAGTARSDVYSLGVLLYEMIAGVPPYWGLPRGPAPSGLPSDTVPLDRRVTNCNPAVAAAVRQALQMDPARRLADCEAFAQALFGEDFILIEEDDVTDAAQFDPQPEPATSPVADDGMLDLDPDSRPVPPGLPPPRPVKAVIRPRKGGAVPETDLPGPVLVEPPPPPPPRPVDAGIAAESRAMRTASGGPLRVARLAFQFVVAPVLLVLGLLGMQAAWSGYQLGVARANAEVASSDVDARIAEGIASAAALGALTPATPGLQSALDRARAARSLSDRADALQTLSDALKFQLQGLPPSAAPEVELERRRLQKSAEGLTVGLDADVAASAALAEAQDAPLVGVGERLGFADGRPFGQPVDALRPAPSR